MEILNGAALVLAILILLYPIELWDPPVPRHSPGSRMAAPAPPKPDLKLKSPPRLNRTLFLKLFERQAGAELVPCLRSSVAEKGAVSWLARLNREGKLSGIRILGTRAASVPCTVEALDKMSFKEAATSLTEDSVEIIWRFEW